MKINKHKKISLYNLCDGKTQKVRKYIQLIEPPPIFNWKQEKELFSIKEQTLKKDTPDKMLDIIGYEPNKPPRIIDNILTEQ